VCGAAAGNRSCDLITTTALQGMLVRTHSRIDFSERQNGFQSLRDTPCRNGKTWYPSE